MIMNNPVGTIRVPNINEMVEIVAELVKQGIIFKVMKYNDTEWVIELTGGF
jgi:hypothetical protein